MGKLGDYNLSVRVVEALRKIAREEIKSQRPVEQIASVISVDYSAKRATVLIQGDTEPIALPFSSLSGPTAKDDIVRVASSKGTMKITGLEASATGAGAAVSTQHLSTLRIGAVEDDGSIDNNYTRKVVRGFIKGDLYKYVGFFRARQRGTLTYTLPFGDIGYTYEVPQSHAIGLVRVDILSRNGVTGTAPVRYSYDIFVETASDQSFQSNNGMDNWFVVPLDSVRTVGNGDPYSSRAQLVLEYRYVSSEPGFELRVKSNWSAAEVSEGAVFTVSVEIVGGFDEDPSFSAAIPALYAASPTGTETAATVTRDTRNISPKYAFGTSSADSPTPYFINSWGEYIATGYAPGRWVLEPGGWVSLTGLVSGGAAGSVIAQFPPQMAPASHELFSVLLSTQGSCRIDIRSNGQLAVNAIGAATWVSLAGIRWRVK